MTKWMVIKASTGTFDHEVDCELKNRNWTVPKNF